MHNGFVKGLMVGGIVTASIGMIMNSDMIGSGTKRRIRRKSRSFLRKSGNMIGDVVDFLR